MSFKRTANPLDGLSRVERRKWRLAERRAERAHTADQLATLRAVAAAGGAVTGLVAPESETDLTATVEMIIDGRRLRVFRAYRPALASLKEALSSIAYVPLLAVGRYGPYWVLTFKSAAEPLVLLVDRLIILPEWGGGTPGWLNAPISPVPQLVG